MDFENSKMATGTTARFSLASIADRAEMLPRREPTPFWGVDRASLSPARGMELGGSSRYDESKVILVILLPKLKQIVLGTKSDLSQHPDLDLTGMFIQF